MALDLTYEAPGMLLTGLAYRGRSMVARRSGLALDLLGRMAKVGALVFSVGVPAVTLLLYGVVRADNHLFLEALLATGLYLPLHLRHVAYAVRGTRPAGLPWTLLAMAGIIVGFTPSLGEWWLYMYSALAASVLVTTRPLVSFPALVCILAGVIIWAAHFNSAEVGRAAYVYLPAAVLDRAMIVFVPVWLLAAVRRIEAARQALAEEALASERRRVDDDLRTTIGVELETVVQKADLAIRQISSGDGGAEVALRSLVDGSRQALADARRIIGRYQLVSPRAELDKAVALLWAAGVRVTIEYPDEGLPSTLDPGLRTSLRDSVAELLREQPREEVVLRITRTQSLGGYAFEVVSRAEPEPAR